MFGGAYGSFGVPGNLTSLLDTIGGWGRTGMDVITGTNPYVYNAISNALRQANAPYNQYQGQAQDAYAQGQPPAPVPPAPGPVAPAPMAPPAPATAPIAPAPSYSPGQVDPGTPPAYEPAPPLHPSRLDPVMNWPAPPDPQIGQTIGPEDFPPTGGVQHDWLSNYFRDYDTDTAQLADAMRDDKQGQFWASVAQGFGANPYSITGGMGASAPGMAQANAKFDVKALQAARQQERLDTMKKFKDLAAPYKRTGSTPKFRSFGDYDAQMVETPEGVRWEYGGQLYTSEEMAELERQGDIEEEASKIRGKGAAKAAQTNAAREAFKAEHPGMPDAMVDLFIQEGLTSNTGDVAGAAAEAYLEARTNARGWLLKHGTEEDIARVRSGTMTEEQMAALMMIRKREQQ